jgi:hypothetical protein
MPMVLAALHPIGEVGLFGSAEPPQPDSVAANATHTGPNQHSQPAFVGGSPSQAAYAMLIREWISPSFTLRAREPVAGSPESVALLAPPRASLNGSQQQRQAAENQEAGSNSC